MNLEMVTSTDNASLQPQCYKSEKMVTSTLLQVIPESADFDVKSPTYERNTAGSDLVWSNTLQVGAKQPVSRSQRLDVRETGAGSGGDEEGGGGGSGKSVYKKKLGHRRVGTDGEVTYKRFETTQLIGSIQLGIQHAVGSLANMSGDRDLLMRDFMSISTVYFNRDGHHGDVKTPAHNFSEFRFRTYAPFAFRTFRQMFSIETDQFLSSMCSEPMIALSNPGVSGSIFYRTSDDNFICKTVQHKEAEFLQKVLPGYYMNLQQNQRTLLPKFFGLFCYSSNAKNVRLVVMNNLLPSGLKMHHRFDLKGSTCKRKASRQERAKSSPTFKDLDFMHMYPEGITLQQDLYHSLMNSIQRDCRVLESFKIMDYSLLIGIHNLEQAVKDLDLPTEASSPHDCSIPGGGQDKIAAVSSSDHESSCGTLPDPQGFQRERMIAHSTALESITVEVESTTGTHVIHESGGSAHSGGTLSPLIEGIPDEINNVWGGIPAKNHRGENLLLFIGIIDILQSYGMFKKMEHFWKSVTHDGDTVSVHKPSFYAKRFMSFMKDKVFKRQQLATVAVKPSVSFKRNSHLRRTPTDGSGVRGAVGTKDPDGVTVITIGTDKKSSSPTDDFQLPTVLQDRRLSSGKNSSAPTSREELAKSVAAPPGIVSKPDLAGFVVSRRSPFAGSAGIGTDEHFETGSIITMTSDERVQIYVPSPSFAVAGAGGSDGTPYSTITQTSGGATREFTHRESSPPPPPPPFVHRVIAGVESYRSVTPLNLDNNHSATVTREETDEAVSLSDIKLEEETPRDAPF